MGRDHLVSCGDTLERIACRKDTPALIADQVMICRRLYIPNGLCDRQLLFCPPSGLTLVDAKTYFFTVVR